MKPVVALCGLILLSACGQKGPLYFAPKPEAAVAPTEKPAKPATAPVATTSEQDTDTKSEDQ